MEEHLDWLFWSPNSKRVHSPNNENYGILKMKRCGLIGEDLTQSVFIASTENSAGKT